MQDHPLTALVLYRTPTRWQYAIYAGGVTDSHLPSIPRDATEGDAQAALLSLIEQGTGRSVEATWREARPHWWEADARYTS